MAETGPTVGISLGADLLEAMGDLKGAAKAVGDDLKNVKAEAKQANKELSDAEKQAKKASKNWEPELSELAARAKKLKGSAEQPAICSPAFGMIKTSIEFAQLAIADPNDLNKLYKSLKKVRKALNKSKTVLDRQEDW